jgi:hypothetical protein
MSFKSSACIGVAIVLARLQAWPPASAQQVLQDAIGLPEVTTHSLDLLIGPIDGLTTGWHTAPEATSIPAKVVVQFKQLAEPEDQVVWTGAVEISRDSTGSVAVGPAGVSGRHVIGVQVIQNSGFTYERSCTVQMTQVAVDQIQFGKIRVEADEVELDEASSNDETMTYYFGRSIAKLRKLRAAPGGRGKDRAMSAAYLTSVDRELHLGIDVEPAGFAPLVEWRLNGEPRWLGAAVTTAMDAPGAHTLSAGPADLGDHVIIDTYAVSISSHVQGVGIIPEGEPITFTAVTDPPGYEHYITWCSSTKFGQGSPVLGSGATFTAAFNDTFGPLEEGGLFQWIGVKADNAVFGQDQKCAAAVNILDPVPGQIVPGNELRWIVAQLNPVSISPVDGVMQVTPPAGPPMTIHEGDIRSFAFPEYLLGIWDLTQADSGAHTIALSVQQGTCPALQDSVVVEVNLAPVMDMQVLSCQSVPGGVQVTFMALHNDPEGDAVNEYLWEFGDETPQEYVVGSPVAVHVYDVGIDEPIIRLSAYDVRGATGEVWRDLSVPDCALNITHDCGCTQMDIVDTAGMTSFTYCAADPVPGNGIPEIPPLQTSVGCVPVAAPPPGGCPPGHTPYQCPLGPILPPAVGAGRFGWFFEVFAFLHPLTNDPAACEQGQLARGTLRRGAAGAALPPVVPNPAQRAVPAAVPALPGAPAGGFPLAPAGGAVPAFGAANWGRDEFTGPFAWKESGFVRRRWIDPPSIPVRAGDDRVIQQVEFVMWVHGNLNTCWCWIRVEHQWIRPGAGAPAGHTSFPGGGAPPAAMTRVMGHKCN